MEDVLGVYKDGNNWVSVIYTPTEKITANFEDKEQAIIQRLIWDVKYFDKFSPNQDVIKKFYPELLKTNDHIKINENIEVVKKILDKLHQDNHCPCKIIKNEDTICMCREFREQESGWCHCHLFYKIK